MGHPGREIKKIIPGNQYFQRTWSKMPQGFPRVSAVKNLPAKQEMWVQSLGLDDSLEKEMTTHSSVLAWEISWTEEPGGL